MPKANLTDIVVKTLKPMAYATLWDTQLRGFGIRCGLASKTWVVMVGKQRKRITVGYYPAMTLKDARTKARTLLYRTHTDSLALTDAIDRYSLLHLQPNTKPATAKETTRMLHKHFAAIAHRQIADLTHKDITAITDALSRTPTEANMAFIHMRSLLNWAISKQLLTASPLFRSKLPFKKAKRDKTLTIEQIASIYGACTGQFGTIVQLCILTAQRRTQLGSLEWDWVNTDTITFPKTAMKGGIEHVIPITNTIQSILTNVPRTHKYTFPTRNGFPFSEWARFKRQLDAKCGIKGWVLHDLRRSAATILASKGTAPHLIERILAHTTGSQTEVSLTYNRYQYLNEMREALERYQEHLFATVLTEQTQN